MITKLKSAFNVKDIKQQLHPSQLKETFSAKRSLLKMLFGVIALFGLYLIVAWSSYTPLDNSWSTASFQTETINKAGALGAWLIDFFFVFLGHIGNLIPFMAFGIPVFLLRTKSVDELTWVRFALRCFGFILLIMGLTSLSTMIFSNTNYYSAGGVIGGNLVLSLYPTLGQFGCILAALVCAIIGFIFCSGASFIRLLVRFYHWLTMQTPEPEEKLVVDPNQDEDDEQELEQIIIEQPSDDEENDDDQLVDVEQFINISGLPDDETQSESVVHHSTQQDFESVQSLGGASRAVIANQEESQQPAPFSGFATDELDELPAVSIANVGQKPVQPVSPTWAENTISQDDESEEIAMEDEMPKVSLATSPSATSSMAEKNFPKSTALFDGESQSLKENVELETDESLDEPLKIVLPTGQTTQADSFNKPAVNPEPTPQPKSSTPSYQQALIHPAFQYQTGKVAKPSTPLPSLDLLDNKPSQSQNITQDEIIATSRRIEQQLNNFKVKATVKDVVVGPVVTRYELELQPGVKASRVTSIDTDLARALKFKSIRVAETIPGKSYIGIETPNENRQVVPLREVLDTPEFKQSKSLLSMALGKDISGKPIVVDLAKMPHLLVAGSTGSGKSVGVNTMILSLLYRVQPEDVKFIMIDPKVVELSVYNDIPHLLTKVVTDMKKAANALRWCVDEMERRYQLLSALRVRNIEGYNERIEHYESIGQPVPNPLWRPGDTMDDLPPPLEKLSYIVVIVDEFADLLMVAGKQIEELISRLAQKARAIGIHLILATQRPSVDVITGLIKANIPSRIAFTVTSKIDSRTILDQSGAEALLGRGDMLYSGQGSSDLIRVHGAFMSDDEVVRVADDWKARGKPNYVDGILDNPADEESNQDGGGDYGDELDDLFNEVMEYVINTGTTSASSIQRKFRVGFNRAARIMDQMEEQGIVSPLQNGKREILARRPNDY